MSKKKTKPTSGNLHGSSDWSAAYRAWKTRRGIQPKSWFQRTSASTPAR